MTATNRAEAFTSQLPPSNIEAVFLLVDEWPNLSSILGEFIQFDFVLDANFIASELILKYRYPDNKGTRIEELIRSGLFRFHIPHWAISEIEFTVIPGIANLRNYDQLRLQGIWESYLEQIIVHNGYVCPLATWRYNGDSKDTPYIDLYRDIKAIGILSKDRDISQLGARRYSVDAMISAQFHARAIAGSMSIRALGVAVPILSVAALRGLFIGTIQLWKQLPTWGKVVISASLAAGVLSPQIRQWFLRQLRALPDLGISTVSFLGEIIKLDADLVEMAQAKREEMLSLSVE